MVLFVVPKLVFPYAMKFADHCTSYRKNQLSYYLLSRVQIICFGHVDEVKRLDVLSAEGDPHKLGQRGQTAEKTDSDFHLLPGSASVQLSLVHQVLAVTGSEHVEVILRQGLHGTRTLA